VQQIRIVSDEMDLGALQKKQPAHAKNNDKPASAPAPAATTTPSTETPITTTPSSTTNTTSTVLPDDTDSTPTTTPAAPPTDSAPAAELSAEAQARAEAKRDKRRKRKLKQALSRAEATSVYIEGLPADCTEEELATHFSRAGTIRVDERGRPRVKMYRDEAGALKGDGVVKFLNEASVDIAVDMMDGGLLRPGCALKVSPAEFTASEDAVAEPVDRKRIRLMQMAQRQAAAAEEGFELKKGLRMVVLKHFVDADEARASGDIDAYTRDAAADVREECEKVCGVVDKVSVFPMHPLGPALVLFKTTLGAQKCMDVMHKRFVSGRQLVCEYHDGTQYETKETEADEQRRLDEFGDWLEGKGEGDSAN
jgi:HIV Tat-specific factor 1